MWIEHEDHVQTNLMSAIEFPNKPYGLDDVFRRVQDEGILLEHDFFRMKSILAKAFADQEVDSSQKVYLQRKYKSIKRQNPNSFTELYVNNLLHLVEHLDSMSNPEFLPDLQKLDATCTTTDLGNLFLENS